MMPCFLIITNIKATNHTLVFSWKFSLYFYELLFILSQNHLSTELTQYFFYTKECMFRKSLFVYLVVNQHVYEKN